MPQGLLAVLAQCVHTVDDDLHHGLRHNFAAEQYLRLRQEGKSEAEKLKIRDEYNHKLRTALAADWVGTYLYYYYCENNDQAQVKQNTQTAVN